MSEVGQQLTFTKLQNRRQWAVRPATAKHTGRDTVMGYIKSHSYFNQTLEFHPLPFSVQSSYTGAQLRELGAFIESLQ
jgi:hypothetical protein